MKFCEALDVRPGVTAVIGSGGKSSLLRRLAEEVPGTAILCTTTHIRPFSEYPVLENPSPADIRQALAAGRVLCTGTPCENGKLTAPALPMEVLTELSGPYDFIFMDAAKGQYIAYLPEVLRILEPDGVLVSDNVLQDGNIIESRFAVERRDRTIHSRMREYLYTLKHHPDLETSIIPLGDGTAVSVKRNKER